MARNNIRDIGGHTEKNQVKKCNTAQKAEVRRSMYQEYPKLPKTPPERSKGLLPQRAVPEEENLDSRQHRSEENMGLTVTPPKLITFSSYFRHYLHPAKIQAELRIPIVRYIVCICTK